MGRIALSTLRLLRTGYEFVAMFFGLAALWWTCVLGFPAALVLICLPEKWRIPLGRRLIAFGFTVYLLFLRAFCSVRLNSSALDALKNERSLTIVANHPSLLDAVILLSKLPHATCVMKASLRKNLLFASMSRLSGYITNEDPMRLVKQACAELQSGGQLLIFPEGTRTVDGVINPFSQMTGMIAVRAQAEIQTVFIHFSSSYLGKRDSLFQKPTLPLRIGLQLGQRFPCDVASNGLTERLESYYREHLRKSS